MADGDLVQPDELTDFPGSPFVPGVVTSAGDAVRSECGWHIAPPLTETVTVTTGRGRHVFVDTQRLTAVTEVRDVTDVTPVVLDGVTFTPDGTLSRVGGFGCDRTLELDIVHGFAACPPALLPIVAAAARTAGARSAVQKSLGSGSITLSSDADWATSATVAAYTVVGI